MPITIDVHQGGEWTTFAMLVATVCLVVVAAAQAVAAFLQAAAARKQAHAADRQAQAARRAIIESITMTDDAAMPALMLWIETSSPSYVTIHIENVGLGVAQEFALGYWVDGSFVKSDDLSKLY
ncbi:MAG TPA: hypothetical protein VGO93_19575, partial [Candidatus Xenobia bacterium]